MTTAPVAEKLTEPHQPHWVSRAAFPIVSGALFLTLGLLGVAVYHGMYWLALPLALVASHFMHGQLIGFHEASHGMLRKSRFLNDIDGVLIGILSFMSFTLYRASHQTHHMHLGTQRDEELWPFVLTGTPRWARVLAAVLELTVGILFTPFIFLRTFLRSGSPIRSRKVRRRIWAELALVAGVWISALTAVAWFDVWKYFAWLYLVPAVIAGNLQSWRKYIEHVGLTGSTIRSATRSIVAQGPMGRLVAFTLLHEPYHGVHHQRAGVSHAELPMFAEDLEPETPDEQAPFPSYRHALLHLLRSLKDPRVGAQWRAAGPAGTDS
ncbi:MAG: fatty acid desaturase [Verrucomicrobiaceae bacterium]|nr:MAG: fatty acid desaturase [Verrucomicrobiaceae bacterium]